MARATAAGTGEGVRQGDAATTAWGRLYQMIGAQHDIDMISIVRTIFTRLPTVAQIGYVLFLKLPNSATFRRNKSPH